MATRPVKQNLPADLPENWTDSQYVSPGGTEVGLTPQHGYNYLGKQVNAAQKAAQEIDEAFENIAPLDPETKKIPKECLLIDAEISSTSENPVQNKVVKTALDEKADATNPQFTGIVKVKSATSGVLPMTITPTSTGGIIRYGDLVSSYGLNISSTGLYVNQDGDNYKIYSENNKPPVDTEISSTSTNPVQNKVVKTALDAKANAENPEFNGTLSIHGDSSNLFNPVTKITSTDSYTKIVSENNTLPLPPALIIGDTLIHEYDGAQYEVYTQGNPPPVDNTMSTTSTNPVQNKVVKAAIDSLAINVGTYTGNGSEYKSISLSRQPNWVLVFADGCKTYTYSLSDGACYYGGLALRSYPVKTSSDTVVEIYGNGFNVYNSGASTGTVQIKANESGKTYHYIWG